MTLTSREAPRLLNPLRNTPSLSANSFSVCLRLALADAFDKEAKTKMRKLKGFV